MISRRLDRLPPIRVGDLEATPIIRRRELAFGSSNTRVRWLSMRPAALEVRHPDGKLETIDVGRRWLGLGLMATALTAALMLTRRNTHAG
jgi:hypothetical protein